MKRGRIGCCTSSFCCPQVIWAILCWGILLVLNACGETRKGAYYHNFSHNLWNAQDIVLFTTDTLLHPRTLQARFALRYAVQPRASFRNIVVEVEQAWYEAPAHGDKTAPPKKKPYYLQRDTLRLPLQNLRKGLYSHGISLKTQHFVLPVSHLRAKTWGVFKLRHLMRQEDIAACADLSLQLQSSTD